jgi:hypothetical protein
MVRAHELLAEATASHRDAMRRADPRAFAAARDAMSEACARLASLDTERRALVAALAPSQPATTLSALALGLAEPERRRALELTETLRTLAGRARDDQRRLHEATGAMLRHVRGVVQHMQRSLSHAGTYGRAGRVEPGASIVSGIDLTR